MQSGGPKCYRGTFCGGFFVPNIPPLFLPDSQDGFNKAIWNMPAFTARLRSITSLRE